MDSILTRAKKGMQYSEYVQTIEDLIASGKTSGNNHSEAYLHYTKLNKTRMGRVYKTIDLNETLEVLVKSIDRKLHFVVFTEAWCGDAAQNLPTIYKMVEANPQFDMFLIWRDENLDLMKNYLTDGGMGIPKVIILDAQTNEEL